MKQIYSVFLQLDNDIESLWLEFMISKHIPEIMATGCFTEYKLAKESENISQDTVSYRVDYMLESPQEMELYLNKFSAELRKDVIVRFANKFKAERRIYDLIIT